MRCVHPRHKWIYDAYSGEKREITFPCGHCAACLSNLADSWAIRLNETAAHEPGFIYDTLTLRDSALDWVDVSDAFYNGYVELTDELRHYLLDSGYKHIPYSSSVWEARLPFLEKSRVSDWLKRGRDNFRSHYGYSPKLRYLCLLEFGPKWSRPHVHLLAFGVSFADWKRFWASVWELEFGFTDTKYVRCDWKNSRRSRECISRYVSKYINKGSFDVCTVKAGLLPKAWRVISHGIGKEYLENARFDWLKDIKFQLYRSEKRYYTRICVSPRFWKNRWCLYPFKERHPRVCPERVAGFFLNKDQLSCFTLYVDEHGFNHPMPRYYVYKLLGREPNLLKYEVQNSLLEDARLRRDSEISRIASDIKCGLSCREGSEAEISSLLASTRYLASYLLDAFETNKARMEAKGAFIRLTNHYKRAYNYSHSPFTMYNRVLNC